MLRIAICDDSPSDAKALQQLCQLCELPSSMDISIFTSGEQFLETHLKNKYDIVFLDVDMPQVSGITIGNQLREKDKQVIIIFSTSYPQYAIDAYDCEAFHYLLKPCTQDKLENTLKKAIVKLKITHKYHKVKIHNQTHYIPITEINYIEYCRKHIIYHTNNKSIETTGKFADVIAELQKYGFYQIHQGYIVNLSKVRDIKDYSLILTNNESVMISVRKKKEVLLAYAKHMENL